MPPIGRRLRHVVRKLLASADASAPRTALSGWTRQDVDDLARLAMFFDNLRELGSQGARRVRARSAPEVDDRSIEDATDTAKAYLVGDFLEIPDDLAVALVGLFQESLGISPDLDIRAREEAERDPLYTQVMDAMAEVANEGMGKEGAQGAPADAPVREQPRAHRRSRARRMKAS